MMISIKLERLEVELLVLVRNLFEEFKPNRSQIKAGWWLLLHAVLTEFYERKRNWFTTKNKGTLRLRKSEAQAIYSFITNLPLANDLMDVTRNNLLEKIYQKIYAHKV